MYVERKDTEERRGENVLSEDKVLKSINEALKDLGVTASRGKDGTINIPVPVEKLVEAAEKLKKLGFDHVKSVCAIDYMKEGFFEVVYHVSSFSNLELAKYIIALRTKVPRDNPKLPSLVKIWPSALFLEREQYDLLGVIFEGHPRLERLLLPEDWEGPPPLRKDFKIKTEGPEA